MRHVPIFLLLLLVLTACSAARPGPDAFRAAEQAIQSAERAEGDEYAPVEMRFAREKLAEARRGMDERQYDVAFYLIEQAEINAELAIEKARSAKMREQVAEQRRTNDQLQAQYDEIFDGGRP